MVQPFIEGMQTVQGRSRVEVVVTQMPNHLNADEIFREMKIRQRNHMYGRVASGEDGKRFLNTIKFVLSNY